MKKNIFTIVIFALCLMNVILTSVIIFTVVPSMKKTNKLIDQVSSVVDLEVTEKLEPEEIEEVNAADIEPYKIKPEEVSKVNLKKNADGKGTHFGLFDSVTLSLNKKSKEFKKLKPTIAKNEAIIIDKITSVIEEYTIDEANEKKDEIKEKSLAAIQDYFQSDFIYNISIENLVFQ